MICRTNLQNRVEISRLSVVDTASRGGHLVFELFKCSEQSGPTSANRLAQLEVRNALGLD
jgi:hypothetical protein